MILAVSTILAGLLVTAAGVPAQPGKPVDLSNVIVPGDLGLCQLPPAGEKVFGALEGTKSARRRVSLTDGLAAVVERRTRRLAGNAVEVARHATLSSPATWHGLPVTFIETRYVDVEESHGPWGRRIGFGVPVAQLRATLLEQGQDVPVAPERREVENEPHGAGVWLEERSDASVLVCEVN